MQTFQQYKQQRIAKNPQFWEGYQERFELFKLGVLNLLHEGYAILIHKTDGATETQEVKFETGVDQPEF